MSSQAPSAPQPVPKPASPEPAPAHAPAPQTIDAIDADRWLEMIAGSGLRGPARELAAHSGFVGYADGVLKLSLPQADEHLKGPALVKMLADALAPQLGGAPQIRFELAQAPAGETLHQRSERQRDARQASAEEAFMGDPDVQRLMQRGAKVVPDSIRPFDD